MKRMNYIILVLMIGSLILSSFSLIGNENQSSINEYFSTQKHSNNKYDQIFDKEAEFPGGMDSLYAFIYDNYKYPEEAVNDSISGKVVVCFTVDVNGYTTKHKIISPAHELLNKAALDVIKIVPKFESPAMKNGKPVEISYCLPVRFKLKDDL